MRVQRRILCCKQFGGEYMATSTFGKQFAVRKDKAKEFVDEMTKAVTPTLRKNFRSRMVNLVLDKKVQENLEKALKK